MEHADLWLEAGHGSCLCGWHHLAVAQLAFQPNRTDSSPGELNLSTLEFPPARFVWICCWFVLEICHPELLSWMYLDVFWHFICCCKSGQTITIVGQQVSIHYNSSISRPGVHPKKAVGSPSYLACLEVGFSFPWGFETRFTSMKAIWRYRFFGWCVLCCFHWFFLPFAYSCITARWLLSHLPNPETSKEGRLHWISWNSEFLL